MILQPDSKKILIVDDDTGMRLMMRRTLSIDKKYIIEEAENGLEAEEKLKGFRPDLVILDIMMPGKNGYEICAGIRNNIDFKDVKILCISGDTEVFGGGNFEQVGVDRFLAKPFVLLDFKKIVLDLLKENGKK